MELIPESWRRLVAEKLDDIKAFPEQIVAYTSNLGEQQKVKGCR